MNSIVAENPPELTIKETKTFSLQSLFPARLEYTGRVSGKSYIWAKAGAIQEVDEEDAPYLLSKRIGRTGCCGGQPGGNVLFAQI